MAANAMVDLPEYAAEPGDVPSFGAGWITFRLWRRIGSERLLARGDIQDGVPHEFHESIERVLAKALDVAVPPMLGEFGFVETRSDAVGLNTPGPQLCKIGRAR